MTNRYIIKKLKMVNYKVFPNTTIEFNDEKLFLFDGPNGYGKTSVFEAIEYALTGTIQRVEETSVADGKNKYEENALANNPNFDVIIELVLEKNENETLHVIRKLPKGEGKNNNPKQISRNTESTLIINSITEISNDIKGEDVNLKLEELLKIDTKKYFRNIFYIAQEDRLKFLSGSSAQRKTIIDYLINIKKEQDEKTKFENLVKKLQNELKQCKNKIQKISDNGLSETNNTVEYIDLLGTIPARPLWDIENPSIESDQELEEFRKKLEITYKFKKIYIENYNWNERLKKIINNKDEIKSYIIIKNNGGIEKVISDKKEYELIKELKKEDNYCFDYNKLDKELNLKLDLLEISDLIGEYLIKKKTLGTYAKHLDGLKSSRKLFIESTQTESFLDDEKGQCYNCGHIWGNVEQYKEAQDFIENRLNELRSVESVRFEEIKVRIDNYYETTIRPIVDNKLINLIYIDGIEIDNLENERLNIKDFEETIDALSIKISDNSIFNLSEVADEIVSTISSSNKPLPDNIEEYLETFETIYGENINLIIEITEEQFSQKWLYFQQQYSNYLKRNNEKIKSENQKNEKEIELLKNCIEKIQKVISSYGIEIKKYYSEILANIKIPVYIYTGRILQNYKGGLGIRIESMEDSNGGLSQIRFTTKHAKSHDILYTLSSGQLSGFIIAFTLVLNKAYGSPGLKTILIDDPIQTMDDLNIVSLTDILRSEFGDYQVILSTHEEKFAKYIQYRYDKVNLQYNSVSMLELMARKGE